MLYRHTQGPKRLKSPYERAGLSSTLYLDWMQRATWHETWKVVKGSLDDFLEAVECEEASGDTAIMDGVRLARLLQRMGPTDTPADPVQGARASLSS